MGLPGRRGSWPFNSGNRIGGHVYRAVASAWSTAGSTPPSKVRARGSELQALVAHEVGHEYFWGDYFLARRDNNQSFLRRLELLCDGFAVITLERVGVNPERLISALDKISRFNRDRFGVAVTETNYPTLGERRRFVERLVEWLRRSAAQ